MNAFDHAAARLSYRVRAPSLWVALCLGLLLSACGGGGGGATPADPGPSSQSTPAPTSTLPAAPTVQVGNTGATESLNNYQISIGGTAREFALFQPSNADHKKLPLVIKFHGAGTTVWPGVANDPWLTQARLGQAYLLAPQGLKSSGIDYTYWNTNTVNAYDDVYFVTTVLDQLIKQLDIDTDRIYITGMSSGGFMTYYYGLKQQSRIAAMASISGLVFTQVLPTYTMDKPMPVLHIHGTADTTVSLFGGDFYVGWSEVFVRLRSINGITAAGTRTELPKDRPTVTKFEYRGATLASDIDYYQVNGGGHCVPGVEPGCNQDLNAYATIWEFFSKHKLSDRK